MSVDERVGKLRERAAHKPESWSWADNGAELVGFFQAWTSAMSEFQGRSRQVPIAIIVDLEGREWSVWCFHKVLAGQFVKADPQNGELILVMYLGSVEPAGGGPSYENYRVVVERAKGSQGGLSIRDVAALAGAEEELPARRTVYETNDRKAAEPDTRELTQEEHERLVDAAQGLAHDPAHDEIPY